MEEELSFKNSARGVFFHLLIRLPRLLRGVDVVHAHWTLSGLAV